MKESMNINTYLDKITSQNEIWKRYANSKLFPSVNNKAEVCLLINEVRFNW
jgi:hypothetical protein